MQENHNLQSGCAEGIAKRLCRKGGRVIAVTMASAEKVRWQKF